MQNIAKVTEVEDAIQLMVVTKGNTFNGQKEEEDRKQEDNNKEDDLRKSEERPKKKENEESIMSTKEDEELREREESGKQERQDEKGPRCCRVLTRTYSDSIISSQVPVKGHIPYTNKAALISLPIAKKGSLHMGYF